MTVLIAAELYHIEHHRPFISSRLVCQLEEKTTRDQTLDLLLKLQITELWLPTACTCTCKGLSSHLWQLDKPLYMKLCACIHVVQCNVSWVKNFAKASCMRIIIFTTIVKIATSTVFINSRETRAHTLCMLCT